MKDSNLNLTIKDCFKVYSIEESSLTVLNKLVYDYRKAYVKSYDGETYWDYGIQINQSIKHIIKDLKLCRFSFSPMKLIERKVKNKVRKIYISTWQDKIVEAWLNKSLNILLNSWFTKHSYAYRVYNLGIDQCQNKISKAIRKPYYAKRDIKSYFYSIDHKILLDKLAEIIDPNDYLYRLIAQRVNFEFCEDGHIKKESLGIPFGSSLACTLANVYLTELDKNVIRYPVDYFRYADDFLIVGYSSDDVLNALKVLDDNLVDLKLKTKKSHTCQFSFLDHPKFEKVNKFKFLGLEFKKNEVISLTVEKQRKIINFYKRALKANIKKILKIKEIDGRLKLTISIINDVINNRIRSVAIIDYYLKHINDETKLKVMDRQIAELVISTVLNKKFKKKLFRTISFKKLRNFGLISLLHRHRLHKHGHLQVNFMSIRNDLLANRYYNTIERQKNRINQIKMSRKLRKINHKKK